MPKKVDNCVESILAANPGMAEERAWAICHAQFDAEATEVATVGELDFETETLNELTTEDPEWQALSGGWLNDEEQLAVYDPDRLSTEGMVNVPDNTAQEGESLGVHLRQLIAEQVDGDRTRDDVVDSIAGQSGGLDRSTINSIIEGDIECPPPQRFRAFSKVLDTTMEDLIAVAEDDGCEYDSLEEEGHRESDPESTSPAVVVTGLSPEAVDAIRDRYNATIDPIRESE